MSSPDSVLFSFRIVLSFTIYLAIFRITLGPLRLRQWGILILGYIAAFFVSYSVIRPLGYISLIGLPPMYSVAIPLVYWTAITCSIILTFPRRFPVIFRLTLISSGVFTHWLIYQLYFYHRNYPDIDILSGGIEWILMIVGLIPMLTLAMLLYYYRELIRSGPAPHATSADDAIDPNTISG